MPQLISLNDARKYKWTDWWLRSGLTSLPKQKPKVFEKFGTHSGLSDDPVFRKSQGGMGLKDAFLPDFIPGIRVVEMWRYGFTPPKGNEIQLGKTFIVELEEAMNSVVGHYHQVYMPLALPHGRLASRDEMNILLLLEVTVLHEMVHFFRKRLNDAAKINLMSSAGVGREENLAQAFEQDAYGSFHTAKSLMLSGYMPKTSGMAK